MISNFQTLSVWKFDFIDSKHKNHFPEWNIGCPLLCCVYFVLQDFCDGGTLHDQIINAIEVCLFKKLIMLGKCMFLTTDCDEIGEKLVFYLLSWTLWSNTSFSPQPFCCIQTVTTNFCCYVCPLWTCGSFKFMFESF